jgi:predicted nucleotidyltransferase
VTELVANCVKHGGDTDTISPHGLAYDRPVSRERSTATIERFRLSCTDHPLVVAAFLGGSYAAGCARADSDIDLYVVTQPEDYAAFVADRQRFIRSWGDAVQLEDIWNFEGLGFDMTAFRMTDGVYGEVAYGTTENFLSLHGGPHEVLVDKTGLLDGVTFPLL